MLKKKNKVILPILMFVFILSSLSLIARPKVDKYSADYLLREAEGIYDLQKNTVSNIEFYTTNYGIFGLNVKQNRGGGFWPRGSQNQYIFAGGIWFGAIKMRPNDTNYRKYVTITYNPNNGMSWMVPGRMNPDNTSQDPVDQKEITKYRVYFSTDFGRGNGEALDTKDGEAWPIWDISDTDTLRNSRYFGYYIDEVADRTLTRYPKGPAFISGEDIFSTYKDTDLSRYDDGAGQRRNQGYPLRLQYEQMIYSWGFGDYRDFIFLKYDITNYSKDTLRECWMAPVMDIDIALAQNSQNGASNDRCRFYEEADSLNLAFQWTEGTQGEQGQGFGYLGFDFLESPAVYRTEWKNIKEDINGNVTTYTIKEYMALQKKDTTILVDIGGGVFEPKDTVIVLKDTLVKEQTMVITDNGGVLDTVVTVHFDITNYIRRDKRYYDNDEQIGLKTFRNWPISEDKSGDDERYNYISSGIRDGDNGAGDKRFLMATGPFNMLPGDTVRVVVAMMCAKPSIREEADGSTEDVKALVKLDKFAQSVYDDNFRAPMPPCPSKIYSWTPLNNAVEIKWDSTSETCLDDYEEGMDFMGYRLYRARRIDLDTFNIYNIGATREHTKGEGPFGWKQIAEWRIPLPFQKSVHLPTTSEEVDVNMPHIDSLRIVGPYYDENDTLDVNSITIMRVGQGVRLFSDSLIKAINYFGNYPFSGAVIPVIAFIDTAFFAQPWGPFYESMVDREPFYFLWYNPYQPKTNTDKFLKNIAIGRVKLEPALVKFNPLLTKVETINVSPLDTPLIPDKVGDTTYLKDTYREAVIDGSKQLLLDRVVPIPVMKCMTDSNHVKQALAQIYEYIKQGVAKTEFPDFIQNDPNALKVITTYMAKATNNRTFVDYGDDNHDGRVLTNTDPAKTEKLLNSVDYYYRILAIDEGDYNQPTPSKMNSSSKGSPNQKMTHPAAAPAADYSRFEVTYVDSAKIGGLYNFQFFAVDPDRVNQLFSGHVFELEFTPWWSLSEIELTKGKPLEFGLYYRDVKLTDSTTGNVLFEGRTVFEATPCMWSYRGGFTENAVSWYLSDTVIIDTVTWEEDDFGTFYSEGIIERGGYFTTGDFSQFGYCYTFPFRPPAQNVFGFRFDYKMQQFGGHFRPDTVEKVATEAVTPVVPMNSRSAEYIYTTSVNGADVFARDVLYLSGGRTTIGITSGRNKYGSMNNGPGDFLVTFEPGGVEDMTLITDNGNKQNTYKVPYLKMNIVNTMSFKRPDPELDSVVVQYPEPLEPAEFEIDTLTNGLVDIPFNLKDQTNEFIGKYNSSALAFVNARYVKPFRLKSHRAYPAGTMGDKTKSVWVAGEQNRYYLSGYSVDGQDTVDFVNKINIAGCEFVFDYLNKGYFTKLGEWTPAKDYQYGADFKAGDKVMLPIRGGTFGLPAPGAKVKVRITNGVPENGQYKDNMMEQVTVVPNPYYISHQMQKSPYDSKLFFTKLPPVCTISIYTVAGDLIKEINHDETTGEDSYTHAVEVWDLLSRNSQRVQSQTLVAIVREPNGAESVVQFSIVVGGFRLIQDN
jgi:hypothetical protein